MKIKQEDLVGPLIIILIVAIVVWLAVADRVRDKKCNALQGVIIRDVCYEAASLRIIPVQ